MPYTDAGQEGGGGSPLSSGSDNRVGQLQDHGSGWDSGGGNGGINAGGKDGVLRGASGGSRSHRRTSTARRLVYQALQDVYDSLGGERWRHRDGWMVPGSDVRKWHGLGIQGGKLVSMNLISNDLEGTIPHTVSDLVTLSELNLSYNFRVSGPLPSAVGNMTSLTVLHVYSAGLSGSIPSSLSRLSNLRELWLNGNELTGSIPDGLGFLNNLKELYLNSNELDGAIPQSFSCLTSLEGLNLSWNRLSGGFPDCLGNMVSLKLLVLEGNNDLEDVPPSEHGPPLNQWMAVKRAVLVAGLEERLLASESAREVEGEETRRMGAQLEAARAHIRRLEERLVNAGLGLDVLEEGDNESCEGTQGESSGQLHVPSTQATSANSSSSQSKRVVRAMRRASDGGSSLRRAFFPPRRMSSLVGGRSGEGLALGEETKEQLHQALVPGDSGPEFLYGGGVVVERGASPHQAKLLAAGEWIAGRLSPRQAGGVFDGTRGAGAGTWEPAGGLTAEQQRLIVANFLSVGSTPALQDVLQDGAGAPFRVQDFRSFAKKHLLEENIDFWVEVEHFRAAAEQDVARLAMHLRDSYVRPGASMEVNVGSKTRTNTLARLEKLLTTLQRSTSERGAASQLVRDGGEEEARVEEASAACRHVFDEAQRHVYDLMESDAFPRFVNSIQSVLQAFTEGKTRTLSAEQLKIVKDYVVRCRKVRQQGSVIGSGFEDGMSTGTGADASTARGKASLNSPPAGGGERTSTGGPTTHAEVSGTERPQPEGALGGSHDTTTPASLAAPAEPVPLSGTSDSLSEADPPLALEEA